jgi:hypothetical protein
MSTIYFPTDGSLDCNAYQEGIEFDVQISTRRNGRIITRQLPGARWRAKMSFAMADKNGKAGRGVAEALAAQLRGGANDLAMFNPWHSNLGTLTATTVRTAAAIGANTVNLNATTGQTVKPGDRLGFPSQRVLVVAAATAASSQITVTFEPELQVALAVSAAVVVTKPVTRFIVTEPLVWFPYSGKLGQPIDLDLVEI